MSETVQNLQHQVAFCELVAIKANCKAVGYYMLIEAARRHQQQYNKLTVPMRSGGLPQLGLGRARVSAVNKLIECGARGSDERCILCIFMGARKLIAPPAAPMHTRCIAPRNAIIVHYLVGAICGAARPVEQFVIESSHMVTHLKSTHTDSASAGGPWICDSVRMRALVGALN